MMFLVLYEDKTGVSYIEFEDWPLAKDWLQENITKLLIKDIYRITKKYKPKIKVGLEEIE